MIKIFSVSTLLILVFSITVFSQSVDKTKISGVKMTLAVEKNIWSKDTPLVVNITLENISEDSVNLPRSFSFMLADKISNATIGRNSFYSPVSLTKNYGQKVNVCQNDLTAERIKGSGIFPPMRDFVLARSEKKEFSFDLAQMCWNRLNSSVYPNNNLFTLAKTGKYKLSFGASNEIEIEVNK